MSTVWLVGSSDFWLDEFAVVLSGFFGVRRISGLKNFGRLISMGEGSLDPSFHCVLSLSASEALLSVHAALSRFLREYRPGQITLVGELTDEQKQLAHALKVDWIGVPADMDEAAKTIRTRTRPRIPDKLAIVSDDYIRFGDIEVNRARASMRIMATGVEEPLTPKEIRILQVLSSAVNQPIGREELLEKVWVGMRVSASTVDSHMSRLRKKIEQSFECRLETKYGNGWVLSMESKD